MSTGTETGQRRRRRVRLTPVRSIPVEFTGERAGEGPLTLGQLNIYMWLSQAPGPLLRDPVRRAPGAGDGVRRRRGRGGRGADRAAREPAHHLRARRAAAPAGRGGRRPAAGGLLARRGAVGAAGPPRGGRGAHPVAARVTRPGAAPGAHGGGHRPRRGRSGHRVRRRVLAPGRGPRRDRDPQARLRRPARRSRATAGRRSARPATSRWTRPSWRRRRPSGAGPTRHWTTCRSSRGGSPAACTRCRAPGPAASRWRWSCRRWPPRWPCGGWRRAPGPAGPASCWRPSAPWSPAAPTTRSWCSRCCPATVSSATW